MSSDTDTVHHFQEEAMATHYELWIAQTDREIANSAATQCVLMVDQLESMLSRFREGSDISRINAAAKGETLLITDDCYQCLRKTFEIQMITGGYFDATIGGFMDLIRESKTTGHSIDAEEWQQVKAQWATGQFLLDPEQSIIRCENPGRILDLGGIGKGYAVEVVSELLVEELEIENFMLSAGGSTLYARGEKAPGVKWDVNLPAKNSSLPTNLTNTAISASGLHGPGSQYILNGELSANWNFEKVWIQTPDPTLADALSTAFLQMDEQLIHQCMNHLEIPIDVWVEDPGGKIQKL